ncbi:B12-binding domain-containing radical SAM protein [Ruminiclostridium herbifermentans]|uniref:B12-binding domain-containing radical SAM protein n=1 Tax=Ruminiclostridium herbifermentans TaxID=2488810 RepID=A0A4U7JFW7_9FIRM|nr:B12-binding domain-containing radical SAM protein [Ruminiclostridium herbifermentans]QNU65708.1 B12-binding domain-containing radical SAM protein [Ruminiclostridium herbifermentans]
MKTVLVGINSKYIHSCLAIWYLKASISEISNNSNGIVVTREFTINDSKDNILSELYKEKPDILTFSCYIWNIELVLLISKEIKKLLPQCKIILGGPEVSYDAKKVLQENCSIDFILCGEGEEIFPQVYSCLLNHSEDYKKLCGIAYRMDNTIVYNEGFCLVNNLDEIKSPYTAELMASVTNRIVYYESSRGCPFSCSYCISSTFNGVRFFSKDRVKNDLSVLLLYKPKLIKFVDRTFNCNKRRAKEMFEYIIGLNCDTLFHFEAAADLFDDEILEILSRAPKGLIQLEIGIQTTNNDTLEEIDRVTDIEKLAENVRKILANENIHVHLDLIAGLPYENLKSFRNSFNEVYGLGPHQLQLGFLKLLKGSKIRNESHKHGFIYRHYAPYEVLCNNYVTFEDILLLKDVEEVLERYFNSARFNSSLEYIEKCLFSDAFEMYYMLSVFCRERGYLDRPISYKENIAILYEFFENSFGKIPQEKKEVFRQKMIFDFLSSDRSCAIPEFLKREEDLISIIAIHQLLKNEEFIKEYLPDFIGVQTKNILKSVFFISLSKLSRTDEIIMFDYSKRDLMSDKYRYVLVSRKLLYNKDLS